MKSKFEFICLISTFDRYAEAIIDRIYDNDRDLAIKIILQPAAAFFNVKPLELALQANCRCFLASKCVQKHLDNEWLKVFFLYKHHFAKLKNFNF